MLSVESTMLVSVKFAPTYTRFALASSAEAAAVLAVAELCGVLLLQSAGKMLRAGPNELMKTWTRHHSCFVMALIIYVKVSNLLEIQPFAVVWCSYTFAYRLKWWQHNVRYRDSLCSQTKQLLLSSCCLLLNHQRSWQNRSREAHLPFFGYVYNLLCYLKGATGLGDFCTHILLSHLLVGVISAYNSVVANSLHCFLKALS